eukprot:TRINITY_DN4233_c0_g1_i3.p1 TRINITY_DN4233_c0_g1~~TRINITY_DN4233_c0_g1_i3.p1  ORF type:complete len:271 (-),score=27.40 TRINITY_DN4233_c0_g1_i3:52-864(-)
MDMFGFASSEPVAVVACACCSRTIKTTHIMLHHKHCNAQGLATMAVPATTTHVHKRKLSADDVTFSTRGKTVTSKRAKNATPKATNEMADDEQSDLVSVPINKSNSKASSKVHTTNKHVTKVDGRNRVRTKAEKGAQIEKEDTDANPEANTLLCRRITDSFPAPLARRTYTRRNKLRSIVVHLVQISDIQPTATTPPPHFPPHPGASVHPQTPFTNALQKLPLGGSTLTHQGIHPLATSKSSALPTPVHMFAHYGNTLPKGEVKEHSTGM